MEKSKFYVGNNEISAFVGCTPNGDGLCLVFKADDLHFIAKYDQQINRWIPCDFFYLSEEMNDILSGNDVSFAWSEKDRWCYLSDIFDRLRDFQVPDRVVVNEVDHNEERINKLEEKCDYLQKQIAELREQVKNLPHAPSSPLTPVQPYAPYVPYVPNEPVTPYPVWPPQVWYSVKPNWVAPDYTITCTTNFEHSNK